jgi:glucoamylase
VRIGIAASTDGAPPPRGHLHLKNRPDGDADRNAATVVATDALALVRFGLRAASDPRITDTVRVIDAVLRRDTATGPAWLRYNDDGSGEHDDGRPFDGTGVGRAWPLLAGERAHSALAAGDGPEAARLAAVMRAQAGPGGMLPEQIWDADDRPALDLFNGRPTGAAMPLVWAHAEYVKLRRSLRDGRVFDCPPQTVERYVHQRNVPRVMGWRFGTMATSLPVGRVLRCELGAAATVRWTVDEWGSAEQVETVRSPFGVHVAELPTAALEVGAVVRFTFQWHEGARWEGQDFAVRVG